MCEFADGLGLRPVQESDARALAAVFQANREHLAPWEPVRTERFYTVEGQSEVIKGRRAELASGAALPLVLARDGAILGVLTISPIVRGAFQNAHLGYWISHEVQGTGVMTVAVAAAVDIARDQLGLHRLEAATWSTMSHPKECWKRTVSRPTARPVRIYR
ncbi:hypothetical protein GCM10007170_27360 [Arthrobacter liuii]|uniref:N-acetyltransferase domain-containing protein n=1 Tax=Arthrobacter liuii TaxID=1476996 RepID=A0ABQ2AWX1_9MICC|nr:hypothetical protein GCM10007170_27360 [Arthrobacter liuii]